MTTDVIERHKGLVSTLVLLAQLVVLPVLGWSANELLDHRDRIVKIESSRFTNEDGQSLRSEVFGIRELVAKELSGIRLELAGLPKEIPPRWFEERVRHLEDEIDALTTMVKALGEGK